MDDRDDMAEIREPLLLLVNEEGELLPPADLELHDQAPRCVQLWILYTTVGRQWWKEYNERPENNDNDN